VPYRPEAKATDGRNATRLPNSPAGCHAGEVSFNLPQKIRAKENNMKTNIKIGDKVVYRGAWGSLQPVTVTVESMDITQEPRDKYGDEVKEATFDQIRQNRVLFVLSDGHWAYSDQIDIEATLAL
jgi:hypothetical protein